MQFMWRSRIWKSCPYNLRDLSKLLLDKRSNLLCSFSNLSVISPTSQLILQPFRRFTYVTAHSSTLSLLHLHHNSFSNPSFASPTSQAIHLRHLSSRPWCTLCIIIRLERFVQVLQNQVKRGMYLAWRHCSKDSHFTTKTKRASNESTAWQALPFG